MQLNVDEPKLYKLTQSQSSLLWGTAFNLDTKKVVEGNLVVFGVYADEDFDPVAMEKAFNRLLEYNDALRIHVVKLKKGYRQSISDYKYVSLDTKNCENDSDFRALLKELCRDIPLLADTMYKACMVKCTTGSGGGLAMVFHHFCCDGYSENLIYNKLDEYYACYKEGREPEEEKKYSVTCYFKADRKYSESNSFAEDRKYWFRKYNSQKNYAFPTGRIPWKCSIDEEIFEINGDTYDRLMDLCHEHKCSYTSALLSIIALTVYFLSDKANFCLYSLFHGRMTAYLKNTVGNMINSYPIFFHVDPEETLGHFIENGYNEYLNCMYHGRFPSQNQILMAAKETYIKRFGYNHMWFLFSSLELDEGKSGQHLRVIDAPETYLMGHFHCNVINYEELGKLKIILTYQDKKFSSNRIKQFIKAFSQIINLSLFDGQIRISDLVNKLTEI